VDQAPRVALSADLFDHPGDLIDVLAVWSGPGAPLIPIDRPELAIFVRPLVPDGDVVVPQPAHIRLAAQEPQQLVEDGAKMHLLRRQQRESGAEIESHLVAEYAERAGACAIRFLRAMIENVLNEIQVLLHG